METILEKPGTSIAEYDAVRAGISELHAKYKGRKFDLSIKAELDEATKVVAACRDARGQTEKGRVKLKADALAYGRKVDGGAKQIVDWIEEVEVPTKAQIDQHKAAIEARKLAEAQAEANRISRISAKILELSAWSDRALRIGKSDLVSTYIAQVNAFGIDPADFMEFTQDAVAVKAKSLTDLTARLEWLQKHEAEQAELAELRAKQAESDRILKAEKDRLEVEAEAQKKADREELEAELRLMKEQDEADAKVKREAEAKAKKERDDKEAIERKRLADEALKLAEERREVDRQKAEIAAKEKAELDAAEAKRKQEQEATYIATKRREAASLLLLGACQAVIGACGSDEMDAAIELCRLAIAQAI